MNKTFLLLFFSITLNSYCQNLEKGNLGELQKATLVEELQNLTGEKIDSSKIIVINFYDKPNRKPNGSCIDYYSSDYKYLRFFKKKPNILQFFITQKGYNYKKRKVIEDKNNTIRNLIFTDAKSCGNYIIIKANGDYLKNLGEYRQDQIPEIIKKM
ncbi:hypothetical protein [uncultured Olleya sp.]|uniref:hypothetical protein n=1 Tax=uncultured Olleya sp. TaxID=757243 RepID=UPI002598DEB0|nr:hypothetical protein [uncultured Olleya sp.]